MRTSTTGATPGHFHRRGIKQSAGKYAVAVSPPKTTIQVIALDGYTSALTGEEILAPENIYLCIAMDGEALKPPRSEGGAAGPII